MDTGKWEKLFIEGNSMEYERQNDLYKKKIKELRVKYPNIDDNNLITFLKEYLEYTIIYYPMIKGPSSTATPKYWIDIFTSEKNCFSGPYDNHQLNSLDNYWGSKHEYGEGKFELLIIDRAEKMKKPLPLYKLLFDYKSGKKLKKYFYEIYSKEIASQEERMKKHILEREEAKKKDINEKELEEKRKYYKKIFWIIVIILGIAFSIYVIIHIIFVIVNIVKTYKGKYATKSKFYIFLKIISGPFSYMF